ncbi:MAG: hypothetical protein Kow00105_11640 [Phycisphaeraceae bacterium]
MLSRRTRWLVVFLSVTVMQMLGPSLRAQDVDPAVDDASPALERSESQDTASVGSTTETQVSGQDKPLPPDEAQAEQAMQDLLGSRETPPVIDPTHSPSGGSSVAKMPTIAPAASVEIDPAVLGVAPGEEPPPLVREGEFIVNRRGRLIRSPETGHRLFVFESDSGDNPELPMVLLPCRLLETMEDTVDRRGETTVFILSGQVHAYRGANYLLPTMMKIAVDTGNLTN